MKQLQKESDVYLNVPDSMDAFQLDVLYGRWDRVLKQIQFFKVKTTVLMELYETIVGELLEVKEFYVAGELYKECSK